MLKIEEIKKAQEVLQKQKVPNYHLQALNPFQGLPVFVNENCLEKTDEPARVHKLKRWHLYKLLNKTKLPYHSRIQKKWNKRFGFIMRPIAYITQIGIYCHPSLCNEFKEELKKWHLDQLVGH